MQMHKEKIIFMSGLDIWSMKEGVGAPSFYNTLKLYIDKGHEVVLIKPDGKHHLNSTIEGMRIVSFNNDFYDGLSSIRKISFFGRIASQWHKNRKFRQLGEKEIRNSKEQCVLYAYEVNGVRAASELASKYNLPLITRFQGTVLCEIEDTKYNRIKWYPHFEALSQESDLVIMTDDGTFGAKVLNELGNTSHTVFWHNGVNFNIEHDQDLDTAKNKKREEWGLGEKHFVFMTLCRLASWKRIDRSISAFKEICSDYPDARLVIVGEGDMREELEEMVKSSGIEKKVVFAGGIKQDRTWECYNAADVFLSLNDLGNVGNPLFEALFWGKPIITLSNGDTGSVIRDGYNAIMFSPDDVDRIPEAMRRLIEDETLRNELSKNALEYASEHLWTWEQRMNEEYTVVSNMIEDFNKNKLKKKD